MNGVKKCDGSIKETFILRIVQILGLKPYELSDEEPTGRRSVPFSAYNVTVAFFVFLNAYLTRKDYTSDLDYDNVAVLIGVAFAAVDFFGNLYICYAMLRTPLGMATSASAWNRFGAIDRALSSRLLFDYERMRSYVCLKIIFAFFLVVVFLAVEVICCTRLDLNLPAGYYVASLLPLFYSFFLSFLFGCVSLVLFQRYWVVNDELREMTDNGYFSADVSTSQNWCSPRFSSKVTIRKTRKPPIYVMLKYRNDFIPEHEGLWKRVGRLREIHFELYELINELNSSFGFHFLFQFVFFFFGCTVNIYYVIIFHLRPYQVEEYLSACFWSTFILFLASYIVFHSNLITGEAYRTTELVHSFLARAEFCDSRLRRELNSFSSQLLHCQVHIKAGGFFVVNSPFLFQFLTGVLSSVVFVVQFDKVNFAR